MATTTTTTTTTTIHHRRQKKVVVIMGPTGSGKSKLSIDLATRFFPNSEIINSDKIQVYRGLDITTNKILMHERCGVPHHFLGEFDPEAEFSPSDFRSLASKTIAQMVSQRKLPMIVGGSNSFIYSLLAKRFNPSSDVFDESKSANSVSTELRYNCCFLWVNVSLPILNEYLDKRVDEMMETGMFEELAGYFDSEGVVNEADSASLTGLKKAIGVPEFKKYFKLHSGHDNSQRSGGGGDVEGRLLYEEAVKAIKDNTRRLAKRQHGKILRLKDAGWDLHKIDATEAFRAAMMTSKSGKRTAEIWEKQVVEPSMKIVKRFLME